MRFLSSLGATVGTVAILVSSVVGCVSDSSSVGAGANADELFEPGPFEVRYREFIDTQEAIPVLAFGRRHVLGQTEWDPILTGPPLGNEGDFIVRVK